MNDEGEEGKIVTSGGPKVMDKRSWMERIKGPVETVAEMARVLLHGQQEPEDPGEKAQKEE